MGGGAPAGIAMGGPNANSNPNYTFDFGGNAQSGGDLESTLRASPFGQLVDVIGVEGVVNAFGGGGGGGMGGGAPAGVSTGGSSSMGGSSMGGSIPSTGGSSAIPVASTDDASDDDAGALYVSGEAPAEFGDEQISQSMASSSNAGAPSAEQINGYLAGSPFGDFLAEAGIDDVTAAFPNGVPSDETLAKLLPASGSSSGMSFMAPEGAEDAEAEAPQGAFGGAAPSEEQINEYLAGTELGQLLAENGLGSVTEVFPNGGAPSEENLAVLISAATEANGGGMIGSDVIASTESYLA